MRKAHEEREKLKELQEKPGLPMDPNIDYKNKRTEFKPFEFQLDKRTRVR